jgi:hypothetical protein
MRRTLFLLIIIAIVIIIANNRTSFFPPKTTPTSITLPSPIDLPVFPRPALNTWEIQSIDTMKYSRDLAKKNPKNKAFLDVIDSQIKNIADTGANYVSIDTPYDSEFLPMLSNWVMAARKYDLRVWFRGNWSGWENWFGYSKINREQHIAKTKDFILSHPDLFEDGDIFSACPECENGGPGDPRQTGDVDGFRNFIISEYKSSNEAFDRIRKNVSSNYYPMNGDVARLIMDKDTTRAMDDIVVIDHYVNSPNQYLTDFKSLQESTGGKIILGEFGAPNPDSDGKMTTNQQAQWIDDVLKNISEINGVGGVDYWVNTGGTTGIWNQAGEPFPAVSILKKYFKANSIFGIVTDGLNHPIDQASISFLDGKIFSRNDGYFEIRFVDNFPLEVMISAFGFSDKNTEIENNSNQIHIILDKK